MEKRVLRPRSRKDIEMENTNRQPAKRTRRAISTIEKGNVNPQPAKIIKRTISTIERCLQLKQVQPMKFSNVSSQTDDCLAATNAQLAQELIAKTNLLQENDQKYIKMLGRYYLEREKLLMENREKSLEIAQLKERIEHMQNEPLVEIAKNGKSKIYT